MRELLAVLVCVGLIPAARGLDPAELPGPAADSTDLVSWEARAACPYTVRRCAGVSDGTYFYVMGGWDGVNTRAYLYRHDPAANSWLARQNMPTPVSNAGACFSPQYGRIYLFGGLTQAGDSTTLVQSYDPAANSWSSNTSLPYQDYGTAAVAMGDYVYILFGSGHPGRFWRYYPPSGTWTELAQCAGASSHAALCVSGGFVYASGGWTANAMFKRYNPGTNSWQDLTALPMSRHGHGMDAVGNSVYVYGGGQTWGATQNCYSYNTATGTWTSEGNMLQPHVGGAFAMVAAGGSPRLHAACGYYATDRHERGAVPAADVGVTAILAPVDTIDTLASVAPACSVTNFGIAPASFRVRARIGVFYNDTASVTGLAAGARIRVSLPVRAGWPRGMHAVSCSTELAGDAVPGNDRIAGAVVVRVRDVGGRGVTAPGGTVDSGAVVVPACTVANFGTAAESYSVRMRVGIGYSQSVAVSGHAPGVALLVTFPAWSALARGAAAVSCSTELAGDAVPVNDRVRSQVTVRVVDAAIGDVLRPADWEGSGTVPVTVLVANRGTEAAVGVVLSVSIEDSLLRPVYADSTLVPDLPAGGLVSVSLRPWAAGAGRYRLSALVRLSGDMRPGNDSLRRMVTVARAGSGTWYERRLLPLPPSGRPVKDGGWLASDASVQRIYASKGNKAADCYVYNPATDSWRVMAPVPPGREGKPPSKGASACGSGAGVVWATKGNNTCGFYSYSAAADSWRQTSDVPLGSSNKRVKGGTDLVFVPGAGADEDRVYLLKGFRNEFLRYSPAQDSWHALAPAPAPRYDKGSWLAHVPAAGKPAGVILCHQARYHTFYAYDVAAGTWGQPVTGMPLVGRSGRAKKSKDGGCAVALGGAVFALKGGGTQEFWQYSPDRDSWAELETVPKLGAGGKKKGVKAGADICALEAALFALKGNGTGEFWRFAPGATQAQVLGVATRDTIRIVGQLGYVPALGRSSIYDISGRRVMRAASSQWPTANRGLRAGVYFLREEGGKGMREQAARKIVVLR